jgi:hypothetical protein
MPESTSTISGRAAGWLDLPVGQGRAQRCVNRSRPAGIRQLADLAQRYRLVAALANSDTWALERMAAALGRPFHATVTASGRRGQQAGPQVFACCADRRSGRTPVTTGFTSRGISATTSPQPSGRL